MPPGARLPDLPEANEPLRLADGTLIDPTTGRVQKPKLVPIPSRSEAQERVLRVNRRLADLPMPAQQMNAVGLVVFYSAIGLSDSDIAVAMGLPLKAVENLKETGVFKEMVEAAASNLQDKIASDIRSLIDQHASNAAHRILELLDADDEKVQLAAAKDILDRAGHRPADIVEHKHSVEGGLKIEYIKRENAKDIPTLELTGVAVNGYASDE